MESTDLLTPILQALIGVLVTFITGFGMVLSPVIFQWFRSKVKFEDAATQEKAEQAMADLRKQWDISLLKGLAAAESILRKKASEISIGTVDADEFLRVAAEYIENSWPDTVGKIGKTRDDILSNLVRAMPSETSKRVDAMTSDVAAVVEVPKVAAKRG